MDFIAQNNTNESSFSGSEMKVGTANIKVIGCGGGGTNATGWLYMKGVQGAEIVACNTDLQHLQLTQADRKILLGKDSTRGLGAGGYPNVGFEAAKESSSELKESLKNSDMVFVCAGMGGGTGTGVAPYVAQVAKEMGAIVIGTVTMPFKIERARVDKAEFGLQQLRQVCDTVVVIDNNKLVEIAGNLPIQQAFAVANELIATMIKGIVETIAVPSLVNLDFADVKAIMTSGGLSSIGVGASDTKNRVVEAVQGAMSNPLLDIDYNGASGALIQVHGGNDLTLEEISQVGEIVTQSMSQDANCIWGARVTDDMDGKLIVMTIVTGVKSPYLVGQVSEKERQQETQRFSDELGIEIVR